MHPAVPLLTPHNGIPFNVKNPLWLYCIHIVELPASICIYMEDNINRTQIKLLLAVPLLSYGVSYILYIICIYCICRAEDVLQWLHFYKIHYQSGVHFIYTYFYSLLYNMYLCMYICRSTWMLYL